MGGGEEPGVKEQNPGHGWTHKLGCLCPDLVDPIAVPLMNFL
jgi:hypothetical protein